MAVVLLDDSENRGQSESGPFAGLFGGEEGLENAVTRGGIHPGTIVSDGQFDVTAEASPGTERLESSTDVNLTGFDREPAAFRHGIASVDAEI